MRKNRGAICLEREGGCRLGRRKGEEMQGSWLRRMEMIPCSIMAAIDGSRHY